MPGRGTWHSFFRRIRFHYTPLLVNPTPTLWRKLPIFRATQKYKNSGAYAVFWLSLLRHYRYCFSNSNLCYSTEHS